MPGVPTHVAADVIGRKTLIAAALSAAATRSANATQKLANSYVPAPPQYSVVYDSPKDAGGINPATGQPYPAVGQYADANTNTVHTTPGFSRRAIAQDVGQLVGYNVLTDGDRIAFSKLLGTDPKRWSSAAGANPGAAGGGDEAFADYYSVAATGGLAANESIVMGDTSIDPAKMRLFTKMIGRLGKRYNLPAYTP